jgi:hypothetical protein
MINEDQTELERIFEEIPQVRNVSGIKKSQRQGELWR